MESTDSNSNQQHIVGSAEPLNKQETQQRLHELEAWGVDLSLIQASLEPLIPTNSAKAWWHEQGERKASPLQ